METVYDTLISIVHTGKRIFLQISSIYRFFYYFFNCLNHHKKDSKRRNLPQKAQKAQKAQKRSGSSDLRSRKGIFLPQEHEEVYL